MTGDTESLCAATPAQRAIRCHSLAQVHRRATSPGPHNTEPAQRAGHSGVHRTTDGEWLAGWAFVDQ